MFDPVRGDVLVVMLRWHPWISKLYANPPVMPAAPFAPNCDDSVQNVSDCCSCSILAAPAALCEAHSSVKACTLHVDLCRQSTPHAVSAAASSNVTSGDSSASSAAPPVAEAAARRKAAMAPARDVGPAVVVETPNLTVFSQLSSSPPRKLKTCARGGRCTACGHDHSSCSYDSVVTASPKLGPVKTVPSRYPVLPSLEAHGVTAHHLGMISSQQQEQGCLSPQVLTTTMSNNHYISPFSSQASFPDILVSRDSITSSSQLSARVDYQSCVSGLDKFLTGPGPLSTFADARYACIGVQLPTPSQAQPLLQLQSQQYQQE